MTGSVARAAALTVALLLAAMTEAAAAPPTPSSPPSSSPGKKSNPKAEARAQAKAEVEKGQLDYKLGRFERALEDYTRAYELFPAPALLFNLGQCHRNLKNYERAIFFFEGYLREQTKIDPDQRVLTEDLLAECRTEVQRQNAAAAAAAARFAAPPLRLTGQATPLPRASNPAPGGTTVAVMTIDRDRARKDRSVTHSWWFWTAIAGATAIAAGAAAYYVTGETKIAAPPTSVGTLDRR